MGKKKTQDGLNLGRALIRDRFKKNSSRRTKDSFLHTSELEDGFEWGRLNLHSVTESNQLDDFLATAELAGQEFAAEKANIQIMTGPTEAGVPNEAELKLISDAQLVNKAALRIPRRPLWHSGMNAGELDSLERHNFLEWRRSLSVLQEKENILVTPFERNLECWRQLWRVIERSDIIVQIVDSRDPLMFRCEDLETFVKEVADSKVNVLLINKSDLLTPEQRDYWAKYFNKQNVQVLFWSAKIESEKYEDTEDEIEQDESNEEGSSDEDNTDEESVEECDKNDSEEGDDYETEDEDDDNKSDTEEKYGSGNVKVEDNVESHNQDSSEGADASFMKPPTGEGETEGINSGQLCDADRLLSELRRLAPNATKYQTESVIAQCSTRDPNVGKSSSINAILRAKKCKVSATPGKTKHFQTIFIDRHTMLCDCPGLVMPSFVNTKAEMILNGILPIDEMRDHKLATKLLCHRIPRGNFEALYSVNIRKPKEGEDPNRPPTDLELLNAYGAMRGFMTPSGVPDNPRASRVLLKDYVTGKLLYSRPPPNVSVEDYKPTPLLVSRHRLVTQALQSQSSRPMVDCSAGKAFDQQFFHQRHVGYHVNNNKAMKDRHGGRRKKKEKSRRVYAHLDKHDAY